MDGLIFFVVFPIIEAPLITLAATWIKAFLLWLHVWMIRRSFNALKRDIDIYHARMTIWEKEFRELKKQVNVELAKPPVWENRLHTIQQETLTPVQAECLRDETERLKASTRMIRRKILLLWKVRKSLDAMRIVQLNRLAILERSIDLRRTQG
ncbi:uncharacterized protein N7500_006243 [Penicillium coprophilum]|uniref:uncharacterized protein n=1 Tax=Penicillium coprophilum TaxID=36646 RepID=UPI00239C5A8B|nr:uncharacterized protein N7500_006243 [Penicillium coprophilum]KAJ5164413.1 hypothetical protein N7500_006243 [Penicillium coprophilum]